jgi:hypothetical protein
MAYLMILFRKVYGYEKINTPYDGFRDQLRRVGI